MAKQEFDFKEKCSLFDFNSVENFFLGSGVGRPSLKNLIGLKTFFTKLIEIRSCSADLCFGSFIRLLNTVYSLFAENVIMHNRVLDWMGGKGGWESVLLYAKDIEDIHYFILYKGRN